MSGNLNISKYVPNTNFKNINFGLPTKKAANAGVGAESVAESATPAVAGVWKKWLAYILAIVICLFVILIFIHYTITPVFQLHPGGSGFIRVPGFDDGALYWQSSKVSDIMNSKTVVASLYQNYSFTLDIFITDPMQFSKAPRILFCRTTSPPTTGASALSLLPGSSSTLTSILPVYNIAVALTPDTNDLIVSVLSADNNMENILLSNVPVQTPFRLGVVLMEKALEVYVNGNLMKTRAFASAPMAVLGNFYPPQGDNTTIAKVENLHIWPRVLTPSEIRAATPAVSSAASFNAPPPKTGASCSTNPTSH